MSKISLPFLILAFSISACKPSSGPDNSGKDTVTTPATVGDVIPGKKSAYTFDRSQLTNSDEVIPGFPIPASTAIVVDSALSSFGKSNVYYIRTEDRDSLFFTYESNGDVSVYFKNPGYYSIYGNPATPYNEPLAAINNIVFARWITLPIGSKKNSGVYDANDVLLKLPSDTLAVDIHSTLSFDADTTILVNGKTLNAKICTIKISATIKTKAKGQSISTVTHNRSYWFVPKIGYFAKLHVRTEMTPYDIYLIPRDTTTTLKVLTSYQVY